jgi:phosphoserine phosphatase
VSSWQLIWDYLGCDKAVRMRGMSQFDSGAFSYEDWCAHDAKTFREHKLHRDDFVHICKDLRPAPNLRETLATMKASGVRMAIVSGALDMIVETALPWHGEFFDDVHVNGSEFCDTGVLQSITPTPYDFEGKFHCVEKLCADYGVGLDETVFMGDGMNDIFVAGKVGLTIAFGSDCDKVKKAFDLDLPDDDFGKILDYISI